MSTATQTNGSARRGSNAKLWLGLVALIAAGVALAWFGAGSLRPEVSATGLEFRQVKAGTGGVITDADAALLDYELRTDDGAVLDGSEQHGGPQPFMTAAVYPGFAEAMRRMEEGGEYRFSFPQKLAFEKEAPPGFPANTDLHFSVQVRKVVRGGAAMLQQQLMMQQMQQQGGPPPGAQ
jgi:hypothetical protein